MPRRVVGADLLIAVVVAVLLEVGLAVSLTDDDDEALPLPGTAGRLVLLSGALTLALRRVVPLTVLVLNGTADIAYQSLGHRPAPLPLGVLIALYTVAVTRGPLTGGASTAAYVTALTLGALTGTTRLDDDQVYVYLVSVAATVMLGYGVALGRARATLAEERAAGLRGEQDRRTREAVAQEQARIAREVHDIVASDLSVITAQAAAARRSFDRDPQGAASALGSIEAVGRDGVEGLRRLMGLLRTAAAGEDRPQPGLDRLPWLVSQVEQAGLPVDVTVRGDPRVLPQMVELTAFRIVQEALTNSLKHAGPTRARVTLDYQDEWLGVEVRDGGRGVDESSTLGYGLIGISQRAAVLGGDMAAGPDVDQGFRVAVRLPIAGRAR